MMVTSGRAVWLRNADSHTITRKNSSWTPTTVLLEPKCIFEAHSCGLLWKQGEHMRVGHHNCRIYVEIHGFNVELTTGILFMPTCFNDCCWEIFMMREFVITFIGK